MSDKKAEIEITASSAQLPAGLRAAAKLVTDFAKGSKDALARLHLAPQENKKRDWAQHAIGQTVGNLATRGIDMLVDQGKAVFGFNDALVRFGISARQTPAQLDEIAKAARKTSSEIGVDANEVLAAGRAYVDLAGAQAFTVQKMDLLARAAQASGSSTTDLAGMMYQLTRSMKVSDNQMEDTMGGLINQAKDGAIEAKQMAAEFAGILPLFARFGVLGREGTIQAGALFQVMRDGANSASEAGTMMQRVYAGIQSYAPRFEAQGIQIYQKQRDRLGRKVLLPFSMIFKGIQNSEAMKDPAVVKKMFGRTEGWRGLLLGDEAARMSDADIKAGKLLTRLEELEAAGRENGVIMKDMGTYADSSAGRMAIAFERMKNAVADAFTPERIEKFVAAVEGLVDKIGPLVEMVGKVGDVLGAIYGAGKSVRGALSHNVNNNPFSEALEDKSMDQLGVEARNKGVKIADHLKQLGENSVAYNEATANIMEGMEGDKVTPEAIKRAVAQRYAGRDAPGGEGRFTAGARFLESAQVGPAKVAEVFKQIMAERADAEIAAGKGRSTAKQDMVDAFKQAIGEALVPALNKSVRQASDMPTVLQLDGNKVANSSRNATDLRRK
jgi:hypothetical protein